MRWVNKDEAKSWELPALTLAIRFLESLVDVFSQRGLSPPGKTLRPHEDVMVTSYSDGGYYVAHRDNVCEIEDSAEDLAHNPFRKQHREENAREWTVILYLTEAWQKAQGGELRVYPDAV